MARFTTSARALHPGSRPVPPVVRLVPPPGVVPFSVPPVVVPDDADRFGDRPRWTAFRYTLGRAGPGATRTALWRALRGERALNLRPTVWAVPRPADDPRLTLLVRRVRAVGGVASVAEVDHDGREDVELQSRLNRSCERLWADLLNRIEWFEYGLDRSGPVEDRRAACDALRDQYAAVRPFDIVGSRAGMEASARLSTLAARWGLDLLDGHDDVAVAPRALRPARHRVELDALWLRRDGDVGFVARLRPRPSVAWEHALASFEAWAYRPSPNRWAITHGSVAGVAGGGDLAAALDGLEARVHTFEQSQA